MNPMNQNNLSQWQTIIDNNDYDSFCLKSKFYKNKFECVDILYMLIRCNKLNFIDIFYQECMQNNDIISDYIVSCLARENYLDVLRYMINLGADPLTKTNPGGALIEACKNGNTEIIKLLLQFGVTNEYDIGRIFYPIYLRNDIAIANLLLDNFDLKLLEKEFISAIEFASVEIIKLFYNRGIKINYCHKKLFGSVIYNKDAQVLEFLLNNGLELNCEDDDVMLTINHIIKNCRVSIIKILINHGFDLTCLNKYVEKKIPRSIYHDEMNKILMNHGVDPVNILKLRN
ncbi:hypothetical protein [Powai lake megavirus]|uniref:Uncharacterized protein n=1 Tax=Powai lake megavirus TaxID=1842663 RepID=A0A167RMP5_9VIRU|nr:hypothetical protein QJ849_gp723 [Powai lake megavirus]ANB50885.1 hypothetical protein [Powai lake megavirus]